MKKNNAISILTGYEGSGAGRRFRALELRGVARTRLRRISTGRVMRTVSSIFRRFACTATRTYGGFFLTFGLATLILHFAKGNFSADGMNISSLVAGTLCALLSIPLLLSDKPIATALQDFALTDFILHEFLSVKRTHCDPGEPFYDAWLAVPLGAALAAAGFFLPVGVVLGAVGALALLSLSVVSPELPLILSVIYAPFAFIGGYGYVAFQILILLTVFSYFRKVAVGKRSCVFEQYDLILLIIALLVSLSGIVNRGDGSLRTAFLTVTVMLAYVPVSNMISNRRIADRIILAVAVSSFAVSAAAICGYILDSLNVTLPGVLYRVFPDMTPYLKSITFAAYIVVSSLLTLSRISSRRGAGERLLFILIFLIQLTALALTSRYYVAAVLLLSLLAFPLLRLRRLCGAALAVLSLVPVVGFLLPDSATGRILDALGLPTGLISGRVELIKNSLSMISGKGIFFGVGIGSGAFSAEYANRFGTEATSAGNLLVGTACEAGAIAAVMLALLFIARAVHATAYRRYTLISSVGDIFSASCASLLSFFALGIWGFTFREPMMFFMFILTFGIGSAVLRISKKEYDDHHIYSVEDMSPDSATVDITLD